MKYIRELSCALEIPSIPNRMYFWKHLGMGGGRWGVGVWMGVGVVVFNPKKNEIKIFFRICCVFCGYFLIKSDFWKIHDRNVGQMDMQHFRHAFCCSICGPVSFFVRGVGRGV